MPGPYPLSVVGSGITFSTAGVFGNAASGFTSGNYLSSLTSALASGHAFTIEVRLKTPNTNVAGPVAVQMGNADNFYMGVQPSGNFSTFIPSAGGWKSSGFNVVDGSFHHCAVTYDPSGSGTVTMWADGARRAIVVGTLAWPSALFAVGGISSYGPCFWDGAIDSLAVWDSVKYSGTTYTVPVSEYTGSESGLVQHYTFNTDGADDAGSAPPPITVSQYGLSDSFAFGKMVISTAALPLSLLMYGLPDSSAVGKQSISLAVNVVTFPITTAGIVTTGMTDTSDTFTGGDHKVYAQLNYSTEDYVFYGTDLWIPTYIATGATDFQATISDLDGSNSSTFTLGASTGGEHVHVDLPIFTNRGGGSNVFTRVRIRSQGSSGDVRSRESFLKGSAIGTAPLLSYAPGYGPAFEVAASGAFIGKEGGSSDVLMGGKYARKSVLADGTTTSSMETRFRAKGTDVWFCPYKSSIPWHINRLLGDGSDGHALDAGVTYTDDASAVNTGYINLMTGLDPNTYYIFEITGGSNAGSGIYGVMVGGGSGIDVTPSFSLTRPTKVIGVGDSRKRGFVGTGFRQDLGLMHLISQKYNCGVHNLAIDGSTVTDWNNNPNWSRLNFIQGGTPLVCLFDFGANDLFVPEDVATFSANYATGLNIARGDLPTTQFIVESIKPMNYGGQAYSSIHPYNIGNGTDPGIQGVVNARISGGDNKILFFDWDTKTPPLAGAQYTAGTGFDATNYFSDHLHENATGYIAELAVLDSTLSFYLLGTVVSMYGLDSSYSPGSMVIANSGGPMSLVMYGLPSKFTFGKETISSVQPTPPSKLLTITFTGGGRS